MPVSPSPRPNHAALTTAGTVLTTAGTALAEEEQHIRHLEKVGKRRSRAAMGGLAMLVGIFLLRPSWLMFFVLFFLLLTIQMMPDTLNVCILGGLPYGKKIAPVALGKKPWWQTLLFPLEADVRSLWTGVVSSRNVRRLSMIGRVRLLLVGETWYLQCGDPKLGSHVDVRAPFDSPAWRTYYTCPAMYQAHVPPPTNGDKNGWRRTFPKERDDDPLRLELPAVAKEWFKKRRGHQVTKPPKRLT